MGLIANGVRLSSSNPMLQLAAASAGSQDRGCWDKQGSQRNVWAGWAGISPRAASSEGALPPVCWLMPPKAGAISARYTGDFGISIGAATIAEGRNVEGTTSVTVSVADAQLQLVVSAEGTASVTITVGDAALAGALAAAGATTFTVSVGDATLGAIIDAIASAGVTFSGSGTATAIGHMAGDITPFTELSPQSLAAAVLSSIVEGEESLVEVLRVLRAYAAGDATGLDSSPAFKSADGSRTRLAGTLSGGDRTITTVDGT